MFFLVSFFNIYVSWFVINTDAFFKNVALIDDFVVNFTLNIISHLHVYFTHQYQFLYNLALKAKIYIPQEVFHILMKYYLIFLVLLNITQCRIIYCYIFRRCIFKTCFLSRHFAANIVIATSFIVCTFQIRLWE